MTPFNLQWVDSKREPKCAPDPRYPNGIDIPAPEGALKTCKVDLPYPAKRCGVYLVECKQCGLSVAITTAGRVDDPKSVTLPCLPPLN